MLSLCSQRRSGHRSLEANSFSHAEHVNASMSIGFTVLLDSVEVQSGVLGHCFPVRSIAF